MTNQLPVVAVIGASHAPTDTLEIAQEVGKAISQMGWHLVCGGGTGVMEAACRGFRFARNELNAIRNLAIGVLPTDSHDFANPYIDLSIPTGLGWARNAMITRMADGVIAIGGCSGTLSEIAFAWQMEKPIVAMEHSGGWASKLAGKSIDDRRKDTVMSATNGEEALRLLTPFVKRADNP